MVEAAPSLRRWSYSLRTLLWLFVPLAALLGIYSCDIEQFLSPLLVYSKSSFTSAEASTLTKPLNLDLPPNAQVDLASFDKRFGPGGGDITVRIQMPTDEAKAFRDLILSLALVREHKPHLELTCPLLEWREANQSLESSFGLPNGILHFSKPDDGQVSAYLEFEDEDSTCYRIISKGEKRTPLRRR